jgi:hypothetical protein
MAALGIVGWRDLRGGVHGLCLVLIGAKSNIWIERGLPDFGEREYLRSDVERG